MWMSVTGWNWRSEPAGQASPGPPTGTSWPFASRHGGAARPERRSPSASVKTCCLSAMERELSMANRMSTLSLLPPGGVVVVVVPPPLPAVLVPPPEPPEPPPPLVQPPSASAAAPKRAA